MPARLRAMVVLLAAALAPSASAQDAKGRFVLRWQIVPGAVAYDLQISADSSFGRRDLEVRVEQAGYRLPPPETQQYWRVRSIDAEGRPGPWSPVKVIEPLRHAPEPVPEPPAEPEPAMLQVPRLEPQRLAVDAAPVDGPPAPGGTLVDAGSAPVPAVTMGEWRGFEGPVPASVFSRGRPGLLAGWRSGLLDAGMVAIAVEGSWPVPWLGDRWSAGLRAGWWRKQREVGLPGVEQPVSGAADVFPLTVLVTRSFAFPFSGFGIRPYAGVGVGADLVLVRVLRRGALEAGAAGVAVAGVGRQLGVGELRVEAGGSLGGVDGPLGKLRTGGLSLSVGYHL